MAASGLGLLLIRIKKAESSISFPESFSGKSLATVKNKYITYAPYLLFIQHTVYMQSDKSLQICDIKMKTSEKNHKKAIDFSKIVC